MRALDERLAAHLHATGLLEGATGVVVGVSGGLDSMTLLHLMCFGAAAPAIPVRAAHIDHRMRPGSGTDAEWVASACAEWGVECDVHRAAEPVTAEAAGRALRYRCFEEARTRLHPGAVTMTAHTADDQAETVLFRAARGSGPRGLSAIRPRRLPAVVRPLLPFRRAELEAFAREREIPFRDDPTNRDPRWTRNRLRHQVLPALEEAVPGAARALAALAGTARDHVTALDELLDARIDALAAAEPGQTGEPPPAGARRSAPESPELSLDHAALAALSDPVLALILRRAAARLGGDPGRTATDALVRFVREARSGRRVAVAGGVNIERHLGTVRVHRPADAPAPSAAAATPTAGPRVYIDARDDHKDDDHEHGDITTGDGAIAWTDGAARVAWGPAPRRGYPHVATFAPGDEQFPLVLRPWQPGDRVRMPYGRKKVKKLLLEARIPAHRRNRLVVLTDASGLVLWIPGVTKPAAPRTARTGPTCCVEVSLHDDN